MTHRSLLLLLALIAVSPAQAPERTPLTFEQTLGRSRAFAPRMRGRMRWAPDGVHLVKDRRTWMHPETGEEIPAKRGERSTSARSLARELGDAIAAELGDGAKVSISPRASRNFSTLPRSPEPPAALLRGADDRVLVGAANDDLWALHRGDEPRLIRLTETGKPKRRVELAPGGSAVSWLEEDDLYLARTSGGVHRLSTDASEQLFYGELDWVYQEEVYGRFNFKGAWWSPDDAHLAFLRIDESAVDTFTVVDHIPFTLETEALKYPKAGTGNPVATLHVAGSEDGKRVAVDLEKYADTEHLIVRVGWRPDGSEVVFKVQDREQRWLDLNVADPTTGKMRTLIHEKSRAWVNVIAMPHWLEDGSFIWESERTGYRHLYHYDRDGKLLRPLTEGDWQVTSIVRIDEEGGRVFFTGTRDGAIDANAYVVGLDGKSLRRLTEGRGRHSVQLDGAGHWLIDRVSAVDNPGTVHLVKVADGSRRLLDRAEEPAGIAKHGYSRPQLLEIETRDGYTLDAMVIKPFAFDETRSYPVWIETYSGPDAPTVRNTWSSNVWAQFLAQEGYVFFQVNVRTASGRGQCHTDRCYQQFGVQELKDLEDAVKWLTDHPWADAARVGITGWSYGGFMSAYALTRSKAFKVGIAGGGVYDWRDYDTIYTERYMRTPQNNEKGYDASSCLTSAKDLSGHLLIVHGAMDDNVHMQNAMQLAYELQKAGKHFDFMLYPKTRHGIRDPRQRRHFRNLVWKTIREEL